MVKTVNVPLVLAISYGVQERSVSDSVLTASSMQAIKLGALTVLTTVTSQSVINRLVRRYTVGEIGEADIL